MLDSRKIHLLDKYLQHREVHSVADIGSGDCRYIKYITTKEYGRELKKAIVIEKDTTNLEKCRSNLPSLDLILVNSDIENLSNIDALKGEKADIVLLFDILEHLTCPKKAVELAKSLNPELIFISTIGEPLDNIRDAIERDPEHVLMFNQTLLFRFLRRLDLKPIEISQDHEILFAVARL